MTREIKIFIMLLLLLAMPCSSFSAELIDVLRGPVDQIIDTLKDPQYQNPSGKDRQANKIWAIITDIFDFEKISTLTIAKKWKSFNSEQKKTFINTFTTLLGETYIAKIQGGFQDDKIVFLSEDKITKSKAVVKTKIVRQSIDIPVNYKLYLKKGKWKIYDIHIEGISLVKNYRVQFKKLLQKESPDQLIERLKKKNELTKKMRDQKKRN